MGLGQPVSLDSDFSQEQHHNIIIIIIEQNAVKRIRAENKAACPVKVSTKRSWTVRVSE